MSDKKQKSILLLILFIFLAFIGSACTNQNTPTPALIGEVNNYSAAFNDFMPNYPFKPQSCDSRSELYYNLDHGDTYALYDIQAGPALQKQLAKYWYPQVLVTPIIAIDRDQTNLSITSWQDLAEVDCPIGINNSFTDTMLLIAAISYAFEGENFTTNPAFSLFQEIDLHENTTETPIMICFDMDAVALIESGRNLELIMPAEGSLSYQLGLLANHPLEVIPDELLLTHNLRLLNGQTNNPDYPDAKAYQKAGQITDFQHFHRQIKRSSAKMSRLVYHTRLYSAADDKESILFAMTTIIFILIWLESALYRAINPQIKHVIILLAGTIISWILIRMLKYQIVGLPPIVRYLWYSYYIFQLALPLILLYIADSISQFEPKKQISQWCYPFYFLYPFFVGLVFTNDWHRLVFDFDTNGNWSDIYQYQIGYYLIFLYTIITLFLAIYLLIKKSHYASNRYGRAAVILFACFINAYSIGYILGWPFARNSDITITQAVFSLVFFEITLQSGMIPTNSHYHELFENSPLNMKIVDNEGEIYVKGLKAKALSPIEKQLLSNKQTKTMVKNDEDSLIFSHKISGGYMLWQENITKLNQTRQNINQAIEQLKITNHLLFKEKEIYRQKVGSQLTTQLFSLLEEEMDEKRLLLIQSIDELKELDQINNDSAEHQEKLANITTTITLLLCNIKRRCNLFFIQQDKATVSQKELLIYLNELHDFLPSHTCHCHINYHLPDEMAIEEAIILYDFYFSQLTLALAQQPITLLSHLYYQDNFYYFSILSDKYYQQLGLPDNLQEAIQQSHGEITDGVVDDLTKICLKLPRKVGDL